MSDDQHLQTYVLRLADNALVLGQRLSEWVGHAPALEEEMATANVSLDLIGQAKSWLEYAAELRGGGDADRLAFHRDVLDFHNTLLVEQPNGDYAMTIARQFLFDAFHLPLLEQLAGSTDPRVAEIATKSAKEVGYHLRRSGEWMIRFGDGTDESRRRVIDAVERLWPFTGELFTGDTVDEAMHAAGVGADLAAVRERWSGHVDEVFAEAGLERPEDGWMQSGGKQGHHSEHLGYLLAEMQQLPRAYPDARW
ncbi:1,2-phenylacetyl-CoA epoxidase, subunit C [wastewater metagenome]|uniref:1,2-phenylacetyl-CoA epoxidase, subunit C n=2 Tax=unclassified sequences TaxID=12908 RepID=A0A5B8R5N2_9ZZZZ|nr:MULTISPECIES: 1,2-phenylacetyl-CoA epoxidase subunit PaaC [Arhodomonas]MCS4502726.1 phenylacetate-CoA oxygenase subunit PaaC [Arhodomonas aquaeolei]QEA03791.1 1,2-phenylacetyl-CoA epoxidase, subunit C [uncultured organism]